MKPPFYLNCMDPGGTTGLGLLRVTEETYISVDQEVVAYLKGDTSAVSILKGWREKYDDLPHVLIYENFHVRPIRAVPDTTALRVIGDLEAWLSPTDPNTAKAIRLLRGIVGMAQAGPPRDILDEAISLLEVSAQASGTGESPYALVVAQEPVQAKNLVTDDVLKLLGLKAQGPYSVHINDAHRHAAAWLALKRYLPVCHTGWPQSQD
jgi:hypothetical protein